MEHVICCCGASAGEHVLVRLARRQHLLVRLARRHVLVRRARRQHLLVRLVLVVDEDRAQHLVARADVRQRGAQGVDVQLVAHAVGDRHVVRGQAAVVELLDEPQPPLRERQRHARRPRPGPQRRPRRTCRPRARRKAADGGRVEQVAQRQLAAEHGSRAADQPRREQRVAAALEEVVRCKGLVDAEHLGEQRAEHALGLVVRLERGGRALHPGRRQRVAIELAADRQRQRVEHDEGGRHHHRGQPVGQVRPQRGGLGRGTGTGDHVGHEPPAGGVVTGDDRGLHDAVVRHQRVLDLAQLHAVAADLDLMVGAAEVLDHAVVAAAGEIARAIQPLAPTRRIRHEALRRQAGPAEVAAGELHARQVQLAGHAVGHPAQRRVEHVRAGVPDRAADRHDGAVRGGIERVPGHVDGGLGRAVEVVQLDAGQPRPARGRVGGQRLAAAERAAQRARPGPVGDHLVDAEERVEHRRDEVQRRDLLALDQLGEVGGVAVAAGLGEHDRRALAERPEQLPHRDVEADRGLLQDPVVGRQRVGVLHPGQAVDDRAVRHDRRPSAARSIPTCR